MAIKKININGTEHELQTTIANVDNLQASLDAKQATITGGATTITSNNLTVSRALVSNSSGKVAASDITSTELNYLDGATSNIQTQLNAKTSTSVIPNNSGEIKTKYRIAQKGYTSGNTWYYKICDFPVNNDGNYASAIISGRIGGWTSGDMSYVNALIWNRGTPGIALIDIAGSASTTSSIWGIADLVLYTNGTSATAANTATLYVKCKNYYTFDLDLELFQGSGSITYDGSYITTAPSGTLASQASTTTKRVEVINGKMYVNGSQLAFSSHTHDDRYYTESEIDSKVTSLQASIDGKAASSHTHKVANITDLTATATELNYMDGVTSNVQTQLDDLKTTVKDKMPSTIISLEMNSAGSLKSYGGFIDFHYHNSNGEPTNASGTVVTATPDYTSRIIEDSAGTISVNGVRMKSGVIVGSLSGNATTATSATKATQDASGNVITSTYETKTAASSKLTEAKTYADSVGTSVKNDLLNGAGAAYDTLKELGDLIDDNTDAIEALETVAASKANASHTHTVSHTPAGSVSSTFTGKAVTSGAPSETVAVASSTHTHKYTPSGTVSKPTFTGSAVTSGTPSGTTSVYSITGVGSVPSLSTSVTNRCLTLSFSAGSVPTRSSVTVASSNHTHSVTASGAVSQPTFTGTEASTTSISGTTSVANSAHTHSVTAFGSVASKFTGTAATLTTSSPK